MVINRRHRSYVITNLGGDKDDSPSLFENPVHQELYHYTICGDDPPPPEDFSDEEVLQATAERIVVNPTDTDEVVARKEVVASMLQEVQDFILKENGHAKDYFKMLVQRQEMEGEMIDTVRTDVRSLMKQGRDDDARIALKKYNDYLATKGITPIVVKGLKAMEDTNE